MNFQEMQNSVLAARFNEGLRTEAKLWLNQRLGILWAAADWPFKKGGLEDVAVGANGLVVLPESFRRPLYVRNADGADMEWLEPIQFETVSMDAASGATARYYTLVDDSNMWIYPIGTLELQMRYEKKLYHLNSVGGDIEGVMTEDGDEPPFDEEFHYYLVQGAIATGLKRENDPTWQALEDDFNAGIFVMREELLPPNQPENRQYGRMSWR